MERIDNKDIDKAKKRKFMTESKRAVDKIMKGDNKLDMSKIKIRPDESKKNLADAYRFRMGLPDSMSDADVIKKFQSEGVPKNKRGAAKLPKKPIMALPTNVPRLMSGAVLGDLDKDGKMSGYETARQKAITKSMNEQSPKKAKRGLSVSEVVDELKKDVKNKNFKKKNNENYKKTMGFENLDTRSPKTKARVKSLFKPSVPETTKLADSGFISQGHQLKQLGRKIKGKKYKQYKNKAYKTLVKGT